MTSDKHIYKVFLMSNKAEMSFRQAGKIPCSYEVFTAYATSEEKATRFVKKYIDTIMNVPIEQSYQVKILTGELKLKAIREDRFQLISDKDFKGYAINGIYNDNPFTYDDYSLFDENISEKTRNVCVEWINKHMIKSKKANRRHSSYGLKHLLERDTGIYMSNNRFKSLMLNCGHYPLDESRLNWEFRILEKPLTERAKERKERF